MKNEQLTFLHENLTIGDAIETVKEVESQQSLAINELPVRIKSYKTQAVIETETYFYKIYEAKTTAEGPFYSWVRNCLADAYQALGIDWNIVTIERDGSLFDFEQRQKLRVATEDDGSFAEILLSFSHVYDKVEEMMNFHEILRQLRVQPEFRNVQQLKLSRACVNAFEDYAVFEGQSILLDDAEFYIALVDEEGELIEIDPTLEVQVSTKIGLCVFKNLYCDVDKTTGRKRVNEMANQAFQGWILDFRAGANVFSEETHTLVPIDKMRVQRSKLLVSRRDESIAKNISLTN